MKDNKQGVTLTLTNSDVQECMTALEELVNRGWTDYETALCLGRTYRSLASNAQDFKLARSALVNGHAAHDEDGNLKKEEDGAIIFEDPDAFNKAFVNLERSPVEIQAYPIDSDKLNKHATKTKPCKECKRPFGDGLTALQRATLVDCGIIIPHEPKKKTEDD